MNQLTDQEKKWVKDEIEWTIDSIRSDGDYDHGISFDKKCFDEGDFVKYKIEMLSRLYKKVIS